MIRQVAILSLPFMPSSAERPLRSGLPYPPPRTAVLSCRDKRRIAAGAALPGPTAVFPCYVEHPSQCAACTCRGLDATSRLPHAAQSAVCRTFRSKGRPCLITLASNEERPCLHCLIGDAIDDFYAEYTGQKAVKRTPSIWMKIISASWQDRSRAHRWVSS